MSTSTSKATAVQVKKRISDAQNVELKWEEACSDKLLSTISAHADAVGSPKHIYFPLLTVTASFMGINGKIKINEEWEEPAILWNIVAARKGEKKTAALSRLSHAVEVRK